jgi:hypothetical protein
MRRAFVMLCFGLAACTDGVGTSDSQQGVAGVVRNGDSLNGDHLNGSSLGHAVQWASFDNVRNGSVHYDAMWLEGSQLVAQKRHGFGRATYRGTSLTGAIVQGRSDTNRHVEMRIAKVVPPTGGSDVWHYGVEVRANGQWYPMCLADALTGDGLNGPALNGDNLNTGLLNGTIVKLDAVPVEGYWSYRQGTPTGGAKIADDGRFTFACPVIGAIGKCIDAGYKPWTSLEEEHEACVRLIRADYCGDGTPHTVAGVLINLYDELGVQDDTESWPLEAEWDADGARCVSDHLRHAANVACMDELYRPDCGDPVDWSGGTLLVTELP